MASTVGWLKAVLKDVPDDYELWIEKDRREEADQVRVRHVWLQDEFKEMFISEHRMAK